MTSVARGEFAEAWSWSDAPIEEDQKLKSGGQGHGENSKVAKVNGSSLCLGFGLKDALKVKIRLCAPHWRSDRSRQRLVGCGDGPHDPLGSVPWSSQKHAMTYRARIDCICCIVLRSRSTISD